MIFATVHPPSLIWVTPFAAMLLCIAVFPLVGRTHHWWEQNRNKLLVAMAFGLVTLAYYGCRGSGAELHDASLIRFAIALGKSAPAPDGHFISAPGLPAMGVVLGNALLEYLPFIVLLFSLYTICGGIAVRGDLPAHPMTNTIILAIGGVLANVVGTTGASMLLIRPLLQTNSDRKRVVHTVIFFIFIVSNVGGCLLPIGDPPLFLGYLRGVPFLWTLSLWKPWLVCMSILLAIYCVWDAIEYRRESPTAIIREERQRQHLHVVGGINFVWLMLVVLAVGTLDPAKKFPGTSFTPPIFFREGILLILVAISWMTTPRGLRHATKFDFTAIGEVACLFIGIFITMQVPLEILHEAGGRLGLTAPTHFFWTTGILSSFLDNAPTYAVFFQTADGMTKTGGPGILQLVGGEFIRIDLLTAISLGAVFMGACTYIGNGPNFMVRAIAERHGVKMPTFFGYIRYSACVLVPVLVLVALFFL